ncbi:hypothetical protein [Neptunicella sp. SCSIO 80796]|uniref:hypothetical protein n=1 Tax=Neptunicella plasticusilytica TaxID=3117012 RepID=UPI003A4D6D8C
MPNLSPKILTLAIVVSTLISTATVEAAEIKGLIEGGYVDAQYDKSWLNSWMEGGVGVLRFNRDDRFEFSQAALESNGDLFSDISYQLVANYYPDGDSHIGLTEAFVTYAPLSRDLKHQLKIGMFYPAMSLENVDTGWNSPYTYSFSAINAWIAEEIRTIGAEWSVTRSGRKYHSPHSFTAVASVFKANDPAGTLLAWRGWAVHNRQTLLNEKIYFADYFQFGAFDKPFPDYLTVTEETDGRWGYYVGINWRYLQSTDLRVYYYDNNADPLTTEPNWQYAWENRFTSVALQHKFNADFRILAQWMKGETGMGSWDKGVYTDFSSWYLLGSYQWQQHRFSVRYDKFDVKETDNNPADPNNSNGDSVTVAWRYDLDKNWNVGAEWLHITSDNQNRALWSNWTAKHTQRQIMMLIQYRF